MSKATRYLVFAGEIPFQSGGADDFMSAHVLKAGAVQVAREALGKKRKGEETDWANVFDVVENRKVFSVQRQWDFSKFRYVAKEWVAR